ncbi:MAG: thioredoxin domain-containing protein [Candidatus Paceibacterota bacterium]|jgi:protein-disulfide isomerase
MEHKKEKIELSIPGAIVLAGVIIAGAIIFSNSYKSSANEGVNLGQNAVNPGAQLKAVPPIDGDHVKGDLSKAEIVLIEYSDLECPFCKRFQPTATQIVEQYGGKVALIYRHFPLDALHKKARKEAEASECAAEQGGDVAFFKYIERLYEITPANDGLDQAELPKIAETIGLDVAKFNACLSSGKFATLVEEQFQSGVKAGVTGTPTSFVLNKKGIQESIVGAQPIETIKQTIDRLLK